MIDSNACKAQATRPDVYIIESNKLEEEMKPHISEGAVVERVLRMSGKKPIYRYIRTKQELERFIYDFQKSNYRYLHISCHGLDSNIQLTFNTLSFDDFVKIIGTSLNGKRLFLSACSATTNSLASKIFENSDCLSIVGPVGRINLADSAAFWPAFYNVMFKSDKKRMMTSAVEANIMLIGWALAEQFRFFCKKKGGLYESVVPNDELLNWRINSLAGLTKKIGNLQVDTKPDTLPNPSAQSSEYPIVTQAPNMESVSLPRTTPDPSHGDAPSVPPTAPATVS